MRKSKSKKRGRLKEHSETFQIIDINVISLETKMLLCGTRKENYRVKRKRNYLEHVWYSSM